MGGCALRLCGLGGIWWYGELALVALRLAQGLARESNTLLRVCRKIGHCLQPPPVGGREK